MAPLDDSTRSFGQSIPQFCLEMDGVIDIFMKIYRMFSRELFPELMDYFLEEAIDLSYAFPPSIMPSTIRNQLKGTVKSIVSDKILSEVNVETSAGVVASVITTASLKALKLKKGDVVSVLVKATNVSLAKD